MDSTILCLYKGVYDYLLYIKEEKPKIIYLHKKGAKKDSKGSTKV